MKKSVLKVSLLKKALLPIALAATIPVAQAAGMDIVWDDPASFTDVRATTTGQARYRNKVIEELEAAFREGAQSLPDDLALSLTVHDVDLAGYVDYFQPYYATGVRTVRSVDFPRIRLDYELRDSDGRIISAGSENLKDTGFLTPSLSARYRKPFDYEKRLIRNWYRKKFS